MKKSFSFSAYVPRRGSGRAIAAAMLALAYTHPLPGATWYLQKSTSGTGNWNTTANWWSQPLSGGTHPASISAADDFDLAGYNLATAGGSGTVTFGGRSLTLNGGSTLSTGITPGGSVAIPILNSKGGKITHTQTAGTITFNIATFNGIGSTRLSAKDSTKALHFTIGTLAGSGDICAIGGAGTAAGGTIAFNVTTASAFTGTLYVATGCQFVFNRSTNFGGALDISGSGTTVNVNSHTVTFKGLCLDGVEQAPGTYAAASLGFAGSGTVVVQARNSTSTAVATAFGVNLAGAEFGGTAFYPTDSREWDYYHAKGLNLIRVPFKWERVQPTLNGSLDPAALAKLDTAVALAAARGMSVILDMHNYGKRTVSGTTYALGAAQLPFSAYQDAWKKLAAHFANTPGIYAYDIMNEPSGISGDTWKTASQYGVNGVRESDMTHYVIVEGSGWSGAWNWMNATGCWDLDVQDSANKLIYSAHSYWDSNYSGTYSGSYGSNNCYPTIGVDLVSPFVYWLQIKGHKGFIGEFGVPNNVTTPDYRWNVALDKFMRHLNASGVTATYWAGGQAWGSTYPLSCAIGAPPVDAPAMGVLSQFGAGAAAPLLFEAESMTTTGTPTPVDHNDTNCSGGKTSILSATSVGDYATYTLPSVPAGTYTIEVGVKKYTARGMFQLSIDGTNQGTVQDEYYNGTQYIPLALGTKTFSVSGNRSFRFTITGKNASSSAYAIWIDYIRLTPN